MFIQLQTILRPMHCNRLWQVPFRSGQQSKKHWNRKKRKSNTTGLWSDVS